MSLNTYCLNKSTSDPYVQGSNNLNELHIHSFMHTQGLLKILSLFPEAIFIDKGIQIQREESQRIQWHPYSQFTTTPGVVMGI